MSTLSLRKIKHDSSAVDNITLDSSGNTSIAKRLEIQQDSVSNNRIVLRGQPGSSYRYSIDNNSNLNVFRVFRENDADGSSGAEYFKLDSAGRVTLPYQPAFWVKPVSNAHTEINGSNVYTWSDVKLNIGNCYSTSTGRFTAPIAGVYVFTANIMANTGTGRFQTVLQKNGGWICSGGGDSTNYIHSNPSIVVHLAVGDYVEHYRNVGTAYGSASEHAFGGYLLG